MATDTSTFWSTPDADLAREFSTDPQRGLSASQAAAGLTRYGANRLRPEERTGDLRLLARQFTNPIVLLLLGAAALSAWLGDAADAAIIGVIIAVSGLLGFWQERGAAGAVRKLLAIKGIA